MVSCPHCGQFYSVEVDYDDSEHGYYFWLRNLRDEKPSADSTITTATPSAYDGGGFPFTNT